MSVAGIIKTGSAAGRLALECDEGVFALTVNDLRQDATPSERRMLR